MIDYKSMTNRELVEAFLDAEVQAEAHARLFRQVKDELLHRKRNEIAEAYVDKGTQYGVIHLEEADSDLEINTSQKVEWDQDELAAIEARIRSEWGSDPAEFIERKLTVKESKYKAWPSDLRATFEPARTVKAAAPTISVKPKK